MYVNCLSPEERGEIQHCAFTKQTGDVQSSCSIIWDTKSFRIYLLLTDRNWFLHLRQRKVHYLWLWNKLREKQQFEKGSYDNCRPSEFNDKCFFPQLHASKCVHILRKRKSSYSVVFLFNVHGKFRVSAVALKFLLSFLLQLGQVITGSQEWNIFLFKAAKLLNKQTHRIKLCPV